MAEPKPNRPLAIVHGGGEMGSAAAHGLCCSGSRVLVIDRARPSALRWGVCFARAIVDGSNEVEGVKAVLCETRAEEQSAWSQGYVAVRIAERLPDALGARVIVDARMRQLKEPQTLMRKAPITIGLGPGFEAGTHAHFVIESNRGPRLGHVLHQGYASAHTGTPGDVLGFTEERVLRAPKDGIFRPALELGAWVEVGDTVGFVGGSAVRSRQKGMLRGLKLAGVAVHQGHKVGDVDPRRQPHLLHTMTDKARALRQGVLSAVEQANREGGLPNDMPTSPQSEQRTTSCT